MGLVYYNPVDFVLQFEAAKKIAQGKLLYRDIGKFMTDSVELPRPQYPPLYLYTLGLLIAIIGVDVFTWQTAKLFLIIVNLIVGILIYLIIKDYLQSHPKGNLLALTAMNWFLLNPSTLGVIFGGYHENFMIFFVLLGFILLRNNNNCKSGLFFGFALLVKPIAGIYMLPILVWGVHMREIKSIIPWAITGITFLLGSLPFLLLAPVEYLSDVFLIHVERPDPSMSLYTYFLQDLSATLIPFIIQLVFIGLYLIFLIIKVPVTKSRTLIEAVLPFMTIFMAFNRILYPHYIPFFFPFFTISLFFLIADYSSPEEQKKSNLFPGMLIVGLFFVYLGYGFWSILWSIEGYETYLSNPFFPISAIISIVGLIIISFTSLLYLNYRSEKKDEIFDQIELI
ncbi:MAG: hypothetical protein ACFE98_18130 [Candidatus Hermodarchaeota archaeon]